MGASGKRAPRVMRGVFILSILPAGKGRVYPHTKIFGVGV